MKNRTSTRIGVGIALAAIGTAVASAKAGSAAQRSDPPPNCGGPATGARVLPAAAATRPAGEGRDSARRGEQSVVLRTVADVAMPGGTVRFDYQTLDDSAGLLYVSHMGAGQIVVVDTRAGLVVATIGGLPQVTGVWVVPALHRLYASPTGLHQAAIIDTRTLAIVARTGRIGFPDGIAYAPNARKVFVSDESGGGELVIDAASDRATGKIPLGGEAGNTIYDAGSGCILVAVQTQNLIAAINPVTDRIVGQYAFPGANHPHGMFADALHRLLFVANEDDATLAVIDLRTMRETQRQRVGRDPDVLAFDPAWLRLYVASESGVVTIFDERADSLVRVGSVTMPNAHSVAVSPSTHLVYFPLKNVEGRAVLRIMQGSPPPPTER